MRDENWIIETNRQIAADIYEMKLTGGTRGITAPGQFINILLENKFLRRPLSIADCSREGITLVYRVVGEGTEILKEMKPGGGLKAMCPLGNGYILRKYRQMRCLQEVAWVPHRYIFLQKSLH